jgi:hypothetical protein
MLQAHGYYIAARHIHLAQGVADGDTVWQSNAIIPRSVFVSAEANAEIGRRFVAQEAVERLYLAHSRAESRTMTGHELLCANYVGQRAAMRLDARDSAASRLLEFVQVRVKLRELPTRIREDGMGVRHEQGQRCAVYSAA